MSATARTRSAPGALVAISFLAACAPELPAGEGHHPQRPGGCELTVSYAAVPGLAEWDDLGVAEVGCNIDGPEVDCLRLLKAEACRMGGDLLYNVPKKPLRPRDQVMIYRGQVAHRRVAPAPKPKEDDADLPPPASPEEAAGPVVPLTGPSAPRAP